MIGALLGPTAAGKSAVAMLLARRFGAEIVSVDSMQVYRGMDIGTAKPTREERTEVPHHLIDLADPEEAFTVARFQEVGVGILDEAASRRARVLVVGGSGLHFRALVDPLRFPPSDPEVRSALDAVPAAEAVRRLLEADPSAGDHVALANPRRVVRALEVMELTGLTPSERALTPEAVQVRRYESRIPLVVVGMDPGPGLRARVQARFDGMLTAGLLGEVAALAPRLGVTAAQAVGYRELLPVVRDEESLDEGVRHSIEATTALARRQRTFHRRDPRIRWLEWDDDPAVVAGRAADVLEEAGWTS